ncbi:MAG: serine/threonine-protein kinase [Planctomycetales bacterium]|nr:serine/threonine-protein kinase [Planctomycetales bacterium]
MLQLLMPAKKSPISEGGPKEDPNKHSRTAPTIRSNQVATMKFRYGNGDRPLEGFTIKRGVGLGGFGEVYFATNDAGKEVALKQIQRNLEVEVRGVRQCMNLKHPNLLALYDIRFDEQNQGWIVMEYVSGPSLRDVLDSAPQGMQESELKRWFGQIATGVAYLHDHGVVHRDLKPANIFEDEGIVKIGDYGLSKFISCSRRGGQTESVGTFHYMAPEIGKGEYGKEIDIYALGVILYEMATGNVPFDGESSQEIIMKHLTSDPDLSLLPLELREVVSKALAKNPVNRFSDVRDMVRPLGMDIDDHYLLVRAVPKTNSDGHSSSAIEPPPFTAHTEARGRQRAAQTASTGPSVSTVYYEEPVARAVQTGWRGLNDWWAGLRVNPGAKAVLLAVAIVASVLNMGTILSMVMVSLTLYVPYFCVWWLLRGPSSVPPPLNPIQRSSQPQVSPAPHFVRSPQAGRRAPKPLSLRQWRLARRTQLVQCSRAQRWYEVTGSWLGSTGVISVFCVLATVFQLGAGQPAQPIIMGMIWASLTALLTAWVTIALGKRWQNEEGDWAIRSFTQLTSGFLIGGVAFLLASSLLIPWEAITQENLGEIRTSHWVGFFSGKQPLLPAYLAYFPLLMGAIPFWKQVDPLRRKRFSLWAVVWSGLAASVVHLLIPFPHPWGVIVAAGTSIAVQLSSPWINSEERFHLAPSHEVMS